MKRVLIIGAGVIAKEYLKVIKMRKGIIVSCIFSRTYSKTLSLSKKFKIKKIFKTKNELAKNKDLFDAIIVAVNIENNLKILKFCLTLNKKILIEKPLALNFKQNKDLNKLDKYSKKNIFVAMNRRFFDSSLYLKRKLIKFSNQKRIVEVYDCQNERYFDKKKFHPQVRKSLMYANSIHLIDYFNMFCRGKISKVFITKKNFGDINFLNAIIKFSSNDIGYYYCDLNFFSKWKVRVGLKKEIWTLSPLESVQYNNFNSNKKKLLTFKTNFKDGFLNQIDHFKNLLNRKKNDLVSFDSYFKTISIIHKIYGK